MAKSATYEAVIAIGAKLDKTFGPTMRAAQKGAGMLGTGIKVAGAGIAAGSAAILAGTVAAVSGAGKLQAEMSNVGTLLDGDVNARLMEMQRELLGVSNVTGIVSSDLSAGLYEVVSAFGDSADAAKQMQIAAIAAKAGNATTTDSIALLSAVTKGYNDTSLAAMQKASDLSFQTVKLGQTSYPELAASIGRVIPLANTMRGSQEDLFGAMATLTGVTGDTAEVSTQLRGVYQGFLQPTAGMTAAMTKLGYADGQVMMESLGLQGTLTALKESVGGNELAFANLFGSIEAKNAVLALTGAQADNLTEKTKAMYDAAGITDRAFAQQTANLPAMWSKMVNYGKNAVTMVGTAMLPPLMGIMEKAMPMLEGAMAKLPAVMETIAPVAEKVFSAIGSKLSFFANNVMPVVNKGFEAFSQKVLPAVIPWARKLFAMVGDGAGKFAQFASGVLPKVGQTLGILAQQAIPAVVNVMGKVMPILGPILQKVGALVGKLMQMVNAVLPPAIALLKTAGNAIVGFFSPVFPIIDNVLTALGGVMDFVTGVFTGDWTLAWQGVQDIFGNVFQALVGLVKLPFNTIIGGINGVFASIGSFTVPDWVPMIGGASVTLPQIPMLYTGARDFPGGSAIVGERGPELVTLPRGANVYSNPETTRLLSAQMAAFDGAYPVPSGPDSLPPLPSWPDSPLPSPWPELPPTGDDLSPVGRERDFGGQTTFQFTVKNEIHGPITREQAKEAAAITKQEFKRMLDEIRREERRAAFSG